ncbi:hypothetical protein [Marivita sp.]|uniref:hypothetical protein n=1 Tax=Marivita sp. TaxID=2003365 RepID=UPI003F730B91
MADLAHDTALAAHERLYDIDHAAAVRNAKIGIRFAVVSKGTSATYEAVATPSTERFHAAYLVEPHGRGHRELHDLGHRQRQAFVVIEAAEEAVQLILGGPAIPLGSFADQPETFEGDASQIDGFGGYVETMDSGGMGYDHLGNADIDAKRHRSRTLLRPHLAVVDQFLPVEEPDFSFPRSRLSVVSVAALARDAAVCLPRTYQLCGGR